jgi:hypothetical protein
MALLGKLKKRKGISPKAGMMSGMIEKLKKRRMKARGEAPASSDTY